MQLIITIISSLYVLFLPGFFLSFIFFKHKHIDLVERVALAFGLSITVVSLMTFYGNLLGIPISSVSVMLEATVIIFLTGIVLLREHIKQKS